MSGRFRIWVFAVLGFTIVIAGFVYLSVYKAKKYNPDTILEALPDDAFLFYKGTDVMGSLERLVQSSFGQNLKKNPAVGKLIQDFNFLDSLVAGSEFLESFSQANKLISFHKTSMDKVQVLAVINVNKKISLQDVEQLLPEDKGLKPVARTFLGEEINDFQFSQNKSALALAFIDHLMIISKSPVLVEDAIRTYKKGGQNEKLKQLVANKRLNERWVVNYSLLPSIAEMIVAPEFSGFFSRIDFNQYGIYDLRVEENELALRGNISFADTLDSKLSLLQGQSARKPEFTKVISNKTSFLVGYNINNFQQYYKTYNARYVDKSEKTKYEKEHSVDIENDFVPLMYGPFVYSVSEPITENIASSANLIFKVFESEKSIRFFSNPESDFSYADSIQPEREIDYREFKIYRSQLGRIFKYVFNNLIEFDDDVFFTNIRDYLIFSSNFQALRRSIDDYISQQTLSTSTSFYKFSEKLSSRSNFIFYVNPSRSLKIPEFYLKEELKQDFLKNRNNYKNYSAFAFQFSLENRNIYNEVILNYSSQYVRQKEYLWELELDTLIASKPFVVKNHNDGSNEIIVFDQKHNMYLVSTSGVLLWKRNLGEALVGDIYQIDLYNNKKLQYLFSTENKLHLIDRLGRDVANYPIRLSSTSTTGVVAYDMRKNNKHKYYVGTDNNYVFGYNEAGRPLNGWNPIKINGNLDFPVKYFIKENKTYMLAMSSTGSFYLWNINGGNIIKPIKLGTKFNSPLQIQFEKDFSKTHLISVDTSGKTYFIYLTGNVEVHEFGAWTEHVDFKYLDVNQDGYKELVLAENNSVLGFSHDGQIVFSTNLETKISGRPEYIKIGDKYYVAYLNKTFGQLYMVDLDGQVNPNFPIDCNISFNFYDLDSDGAPEVIGANNNKLFITRF